MNEQSNRVGVFLPNLARLLFWLAGSSLFLGLFIKLTWELREGDVGHLDQLILVAMSRLRVPPLNSAAVEITALGSLTLIFIFTSIGLLFLLLSRDHLGAIYLATGAGGAGIWAYALKYFFPRGRPTMVPWLVEVSGSSYPSGHSLVATSFYLLLAFLACRHYHSTRARLAIFAVAFSLIAAVCMSRLYLGIHYPSDVVGGVFFGMAWTFLITGILLSRSRREPEVL